MARAPRCISSPATTVSSHKHLINSLSDFHSIQHLLIGKDEHVVLSLALVHAIAPKPTRGECPSHLVQLTVPLHDILGGNLNTTPVIAIQNLNWAP